MLIEGVNPGDAGAAAGAGVAALWLAARGCSLLARARGFAAGSGSRAATVGLPGQASGAANVTP